ncbi:MAG TPA: rhamnulokinase family protein [Limnochordia bacterium]|jgi:rhamnulokinase|nr:rhamnulokinase [Bacillota bacterium]HOB09092.1 rhamnulokinase family protein [Limnochordia bacterium]HPZ30034.1 rhamnulokinase family protein [Limnochordia bacterium]HQD70867.1 rhamnulokinase family protein [Limnochordia bacterium]
MASKLNLLAFDLGASNGRAIVGQYDGERLNLIEVHKFPNGPQTIHGHMYWNILDLFAQIKTGVIKACAAVDGRIDSMAIDTWGVDYGLLDANDTLLSNPYHYRDKRTDGLLDEIFAAIGSDMIYDATGIQFMQINTLVQLYADRRWRPWVLDNARTLLFIPDLLNFFLTGQKYNEYTISSTSQLLNATTLSWVERIFTALDLPIGLMQSLVFPGAVIGTVTEQIKAETGIGWDIPVIAVGSHDTASAVAAVPLVSSEDSVYISSGTWSLLGMELEKPVINEHSRRENFTNEGGVGKTIRFLKNISGLWLIQECRRIWQRDGLTLSWDQISKAAEAAPLKALINPDDPRFLNPDNMPEAIVAYCRETGQDVPANYGEIARCVYESLAVSYEKTIAKLEAMLGRRIETIHMVGGGIQAEILCQFTANTTRRTVVTGPIEATAMGNMLGQLLAKGEINSLEEGRELIRRSVELKTYLPQ